MCQAKHIFFYTIVIVAIFVTISACSVNPEELQTPSPINLTETFETELQTRVSATSTMIAAETATSEALTIKIQEGIEATTTAIAVGATPNSEDEDMSVLQLKILSRSVNVQNGPGTCYEQIAFLQQGDAVTVLAHNRDFSWYIIQTNSGVTGWLDASDIEPVSQEILEDISLASTIPPCPTSTSSPSPLPLPQPVTPTSEVTSVIFDVYYCKHIGGKRFEWYQVEVFYENETPFKETILDGPFTGYWQSRCPPIPSQQPDEPDPYPLPSSPIYP